MKLEESNTNITRTQELEKEIKEKQLLIGKIRHEGTYMYWYYCLRSINVLLAVIMNEHLMEALRQLRRNSMLTDVWSLMFASRSSQHHERFEMLSLLASVLSWNDLEREKAGLQHVNSSDTSTASSFWSRSSNVGSSAKAELDKSDETEVSLLIHFTLYTDILTLPGIVFLSTLGRSHRSICW
jgi:hypothetical protein